jgi:FtsP/CotA-like multicopper oxidase with cupredoxin domain
VVEGDRVRIFVTNKLPEHTSVHWHGQRLPNGMDGVSGLTQKAIQPARPLSTSLWRAVPAPSCTTRMPTK